MSQSSSSLNKVTRSDPHFELLSSQPVNPSTSQALPH